MDRTAASNGDVRFTRYPFELLGYWYATPQFRLGGGLRKALSPKLSSSGVAAGLGNASLSANVGVVLEGEYQFNPHFGITLRGVAEKYKFDNGAKADGNHFGVRFNYYF